MALSETFNLDFKFGGNIELLAKLEALLQRIDGRFDSFEDSVKDATDATDKMADKVDDLNDSFRDGVGAMSEFGEKLKDIAKYYLSFQAIRAGAERVWSFGMQSMDAYSTQERAENQLKGVMKNRGTLDQFQTIKDFAANIQGRSIYGDEAMIRGAGELATYVKGTGSLMSMMELLTDYAAGMTGGGEVSPEQMESLATGLGMAYDGNYMAMRRKGFDTSKLEALDAIVENGGVWGAKERKKYGDVLDADLVKQIKELGGVSEQMRVDALKESLGDWKGLSEEVNKLDSSALIRFNNKLGDLRESVGKKLYPVFNKLVGMIDENMPKIEAFFDSVAEMFTAIANAIMENMGTLVNVTQTFTEAIKFLANWYKPLIATVMAMKLVPPALKAISVASTNVSTYGLSGLAKSLTSLVNPAALAGVAVVGLASTLWNVWKKTEEENNRKARDISSANADSAIAKYADLRKRYDAATNEYQKRGLAAEMDKARAEAENQVSIYAQANGGYAKAEWAKFFRTGVMMKGYSGQNKGMVKFTEGALVASGKNPFEDLMKELKTEGKTEMHNTFNNTTINQKVNITAEAEKIGMMLNFSIQKAIKNLYKRNGVVAEVGVI
ncbi:MAG: hypothetical protein IKS96_07280 [Fibrobacter sp.]|nr:hypothetical protein [Fibrobacter sp.]MBR6449730.1 hypothetical protein [Fibrobacter sp.]